MIPPHVSRAIDEIFEGATADSQESDILEFKEDPAARGQNDNARAKLIEKLIDEAVCLANGDAAGGHIVVGIADKIAGQDAFTGTDFDAADIELKIFHGTVPQLRVEAEEVEVHGARLIVIRIPEALDLYQRTKGQASRRVGSSCEVLSENERRSIRATRANPDYSNRAGTARYDDVPLHVIGEVGRLLREQRRLEGKDPGIPESPFVLLREIGLVEDDGRLKKAAEILLLPPQSRGEVNIRYLWRALPGSSPQTTELDGPIISELVRLKELIRSHADSEVARIQFDSGQEMAIPAFPSVAIDETVTNALIHRDWRLSNPVVVDQSSYVLKVWSPGSLPTGVNANRLLTTQSVPRNNRLMSSMRMLGLAEESSRGFDRMWASMLMTGREVPEVNIEPNSVEVVLAAGHPDTAFVYALSKLREAFGEECINNVMVLIVLWHLWDAQVLTLNALESKTQTVAIEAKELMAGLVQIGLVQQVRDASEWVLSDKSRRAMGMEGAGNLASVSVEEWIRVQLEDGAVLSSSEVAEELGIARKEVTDHFRHLRTLGRARIDPDGPQRGPSTRWMRGD